MALRMTQFLLPDAFRDRRGRADGVDGGEGAAAISSRVITSDNRKRRWPPAVRWQASLPCSVYRRTVALLRLRIAAASCRVRTGSRSRRMISSRVSVSGRRPPFLRGAAAPPSAIGSASCVGTGRSLLPDRVRGGAGAAGAGAAARSATPIDLDARGEGGGAGESRAGSLAMTSRYRYQSRRSFTASPRCVSWCDEVSGPSCGRAKALLAVREASGDSSSRPGAPVGSCAGVLCWPRLLQATPACPPAPAPAPPRSGSGHRRMPRRHQPRRGSGWPRPA